MNATCVIEQLHEALAGRAAIAFGYVHGSVLTTTTPRDVDVALYLDDDFHKKGISAGSLLLEFVIPMEAELEHVLGCPIDIQILNTASLPFRFRVVAEGVLVADQDVFRRTEFESLTRCEYFDFCFRREEYLAEISK